MSLKDFQQKIGVTADGAWGPGTFKAAVAFYKMNPIRAAHFFAQAAHESGNFVFLSENLNYTAEQLTKVWPKLFPADVAAKYAKQPEKIANRAYGNRMGNGSEDSGDGWKYKGRGVIQLTGKDNYTAFSKAITRPDVLTKPDIVSGELAFESAMFFFDKNKLWDICDKGVNDDTIIQLTKRINGGTHGLEDRKEKTYKFAKILNV
jgi:putative chitinase